MSIEEKGIAASIPEEQNGRFPAPSPPASAPENAPTPPPPDPKNLNAVVRAAVAKASEGQPRDQAGRFATQPPLPKPNGTVPRERPRMPKAFRGDIQNHWDAVPETNLPLLQAIVEREEAHQRGLEPFIEPYKTAKQQYEEFMGLFKPFEPMLRGQNPKDFTNNLLQTAAIFHMGTPMQKTQGIIQLMQQAGIPWQSVQQLLSGNAPQTPSAQPGTYPQGLAQPAVDPHIQQLSQQVQQLTEFQQREDETRRMNLVNGFFEDAKHKYLSVDGIPEQIAQLVKLPAESLGLDPGSGDQEKLEAAYEIATWRDPKVRQQRIADEQTPQRGTVERAKQAAVQVTGAPSSQPAAKVNPKDLRALIASQVQKAR